MTNLSLTGVYRAYIKTINERHFAELENYVQPTLTYNNEQLTFTRYSEMLMENCRQIPDLYFDIQVLITEGNTLACRLGFDCTPTMDFMDMPTRGKRLKFHENVFYEFQENKISKVWSVIDKEAIEQQLAGR